MGRGRPKVFLTGRPGIGKTTVVLRVVEALQGRPMCGFYTRELRQGGRRVGFEAVGLRTGQRCILAHVSDRSGPRVGRYRVRTEEFAKFLDSEFGEEAPETGLVVLDEVGKMECLVGPFVELVERILQSETPVLGTVAERAGGLPARIRSAPDIELLHVSESNRDALPDQLAQRFRTA